MTSKVHINITKGTSLLKLWNAHPKSLRRVQLRYWTPDSAHPHPEIDLLNTFDSKEHAAFDLLAQPTLITAMQFVYWIGFKRRETAVISPKPINGPNAYIRDLIFELSGQDDQDPVHFPVFDDAKNARSDFFDEFSDQLPGLHTELSVLNQPLKERLVLKPIGDQGNVAFFDVRNARDLYLYPSPVEALTMHLVAFDGTQSQHELSPAVWAPRLARVEFGAATQCMSFWLSWKLGGQPQKTKRQDFPVPIAWGEAIINEDGQSGGLWIWLDWLQTHK